MQFKTRQFELVSALNAERTVTRAAAKLGLTQPAVSHALGELERQCAQELFIRDRKGLRPTPAGERLVEEAEVILARLHKLRQDLNLFSRGQKGVLRISMECYTGYSWLPEVLAPLGRDFPEHEIQLVPEAAKDLALWLRRRELDMAITHTPQLAPDLRTKDLFRDELVAVLGKGHPLAGKSSLKPEDFDNQRVFLHSDPHGSALFREFLNPAGVSPGGTSQLQLTEAVLAAVRAGLGITVMATWVIQKELDSGDLVSARLGRHGLHRTWRATFLRSSPENPARDSLVQLLADSKVSTRRIRLDSGSR